MGNIVKVNCGKAKSVTSAPLWQYDYGQILKIEGIELPTAYQVHFSNEPYGTSTTSIGTAEGVEIPDAYLQGGADVYAWLYLHEGEDDGETVLTIRIPVQARAAITNDEPTPVQQDEIDELITALNIAVDAAEDAEDAAEAAAEAIENMGVSASTLAAGSSATVTKTVDPETGAVSLAFGIPKGDKGDKGDTGATGATGQTGPAGQDGADGSDGVTFTPSVSNEGVISWSNDGGRQNPASVNIKGPTGATGQTGPAGQDGADGEDGEDGYSPTVAVTEITGGHRVTITDAQGDHTFDVMDGSGGGGGTSDYTGLTNKPQINSVTLSGNKSLADLGIYNVEVVRLA